MKAAPDHFQPFTTLVFTSFIFNQREMNCQETRVSLQAENWGQPLGGTDFLLSNEGRNGPNRSSLEG